MPYQANSFPTPGFYILSEKLGRITVPSNMPNGQAWNKSSTDPYLESNAAKRAVVNTGWSCKTGLARQYVSPINEWSYSSPSGIGSKSYIEVIKINGLFTHSGNPSNSGKFMTPGEYVYYAINLADQNTVFAEASYFINDPYFKFVKFGVLTLLASAAVESWCTDGYATKRENGNIALDLDQVAGNSRLIWKNPWAASNAVIIDIDVLGLPIGGELAVIGAGGSAALVITAPGSYQVEVTVDAGENLVIANNTQVVGSALITKFMAKRTTQVWTCEGDMFIQASCAFSAAADYFTRLAIQPSTVFASTRFDKPNLNGFVPPPGQPLLGYGSTPPSSGQFRVGDTVRNNNAIAGAVSGWRCVTAGNPGTWMPLATL